MKKIKDFNKKQIKEIALFYAKNPVTRSYFIKKYNISASTFYLILKKAIIEHIVDNDTCRGIEKRALKNIKEHEETQNIDNHILYYDKIFLERQSYIGTKKYRYSLMKDFINRDMRISKKDFCKEKFIDIELLDKIIVHCILKSEISDRLYEKLKSNTLISCSYNQNTIMFFYRLDTLRKKISDEVIKDFDTISFYYNLREKNSNNSDNSYSNDESNKPNHEIDENGNIIINDFDIIDEAQD